MNISALLSPERILYAAKEEFNKKRVLTTISKLFEDSVAEIDSNHLLAQFIARERLGSTAIGHGVALPHIRLSQIEKPLGALLILEHPINFDSPDNKLVDIFFALIVPENATDEHLQILARLSTLFNKETFRKELRAKQDSQSLYQAFAQTDTSMIGTHIT